MMHDAQAGRTVRSSQFQIPNTKHQTPNRKPEARGVGKQKTESPRLQDRQKTGWARELKRDTTDYGLEEPPAVPRAPGLTKTNLV
jgi:hypothetical protein